MKDYALPVSTSEPRTPTGSDWYRCPAPRQLPHARIFQRDDGMSVISAVELAEDAASPVARPSFHVSAIRFEDGRRRACTDAELDEVRAAFRMDDADEDNHGPGIARHLWLDCGKVSQDTCPCKADEDPHVDGSGRVWRA